MAKVNPNFAHDLFRFIHKPIRDRDKDVFNFLERFLLGPQQLWEEKIAEPLNALMDLIDPAKTPQPRLLKDHVGFTKELDNIIVGISDNDLRKIISFAVALWKKRGLDVGYKDIIRVFTGANVRIFNWFDFRLIVGEKSFGEEQLGEDAWLISIPGILSTSDALNTVVGLWTFEGNLKDRSLTRNHGLQNGDIFYYNNGPVVDSEKYARMGKAIDAFHTGYTHIKNHSTYDFSNDFTFEGYIRTDIAADSDLNDNDGYIFSKKDGLKEVSLQYKVTTNELIATLHDGVNTTSLILASGFDLDNDNWRHWALVIDRTQNLARLYFNGSESISVAIGSIGDLTNNGDLFVSVKTHSTNQLIADHDNIRLSLNAVYDVTSSSLVPVTFIEFLEEQLDEFFSDIRVVDDGSGTLDRTLLKRVINLMRPVSERLNILYVNVSDDFGFGKGNFDTLSGTSVIDEAGGKFELLMSPETIEIVDVFNADNFQDTVYQNKIRITDLAMKAGLIFHWQDINNYYYFRAFTPPTPGFELVKIEGGVETALVAFQTADFIENTDYILSIYTFKDPFSNDLLIKCFQDSNLIFDITDTTFESGRFGMRTEVASTAVITELEMFELPLESDRILPGFSE